MQEFIKKIILELPGFTREMLWGLTSGSFNQSLEYIIATVLFTVLAIFIFIPSHILKLGKKIILAALFAISPYALLFIVNTGSSPAGRMAKLIPFFFLIAFAFMVLYIAMDLLLWRRLLKRKREYYPNWLKPPVRYK